MSDAGAELPVLHAVRILGFADTPAIADRFGLDIEVTRNVLDRAEQLAWVSHASFADLSGWSLTETGRQQNQRLLAAELAHAGGAEQAQEVFDDFLPLNARLQQSCTDWQLRPADGNRLRPNDHSDAQWDGRILAELGTLVGELSPLVARLTSVLPRFSGYDTRFTAALQRAYRGDHGWVDRTDIDSCHRVWFQLHEDLIATLGRSRHDPER